ncbi:MAG: hypothetical protein L0H53_16620 [Candidatus Nitrosocosmicus sp.]|nr:hypothetical protein [Candidatus Nitrosocosmicus sp.]MDN5868900.1 hypothetical protein [Candidatus Nitrosocosmicus sp.]
MDDNERVDSPLPDKMKVKIKVTDSNGEKEFYSAEQAIDRMTLMKISESTGVPVHKPELGFALCITRIFSSTTTTTSGSSTIYNSDIYEL